MKEENVRHVSEVGNLLLQVQNEIYMSLHTCNLRNLYMYKWIIYILQDKFPRGAII